MSSGLAFLKKRKEKESERGNNTPKIPQSEYLYLRGENCIVKPVMDKTGESIVTRYYSEFYKDCEGNNIAIKYNDNTANKVGYCSPKTSGQKDELVEYRSNNYKIMSESDAKTANEPLKCKEQAFILCKIISHPTKEVVGTLKFIRLDSKMISFISDALFPDAITSSIKEQAKISVNDYTDMGAVTYNDVFTVVSIGETSIEVSNTIGDQYMGKELVIDNKVYVFTGIGGNTFTGVTQKSYDVFGWESEYVLSLSPKVVDNGGGYNAYNDYSGNSSFKKVKDEYSSTTNGTKFSDFEDVEAIKKSIKHDLKDAIGKINSYEESYFKFHKHFLKEDIKWENVAELLKNKDVAVEAPKEETTTESTSSKPASKPQQERPKLSIDDDDKKTDFETKMEAVNTTEEEPVTNTVSTEEPEPQSTGFDVNNLTLDSLGM